MQPTRSEPDRSSAESASRSELTGHCLCGAVTFEIDYPAFWAWHDHTRASRLAQGWLAVGALGFIAVPWYALKDSVLGSAWLRDFAAKEYAPALLQVAAHGRAWLAPLAVLLIAGFVGSTRSARLQRANVMTIAGALGLTAAHVDVVVQRARAALAHYPILGIRTNAPLLMRLLAHERFVAGDLDTHFLQTEAATLIAAGDAPSADARAVAALVRRGAAGAPTGGGVDSSSDPWTSLGKRHV